MAVPRVAKWLPGGRGNHSGRGAGTSHLFFAACACTARSAKQPPVHFPARASAYSCSSLICSDLCSAATAASHGCPELLPHSGRILGKKQLSLRIRQIADKFGQIGKGGADGITHIKAAGGGACT